MLTSAGALNAVSVPELNCSEHCLSVDERLRAAAEKGDIDMLYTLIREDPHLLDHIDRIPFVDTLHIAASVGHTGFARETMLLKPSFARKLNQDGLTPLHLAMLKAQTKMVERLLDADSDLVRVKGREGKTPFHYAAEQGNIHLLTLFLSTCPSSIQDVTNTSDTALHIAAKSKKLEAFNLLVARLRRAINRGSGIQEYETLNKINDLGNTALHVAVITNQPEVVRVLLGNGVKLDVKNSDGLTAMNIVERESHITNNEARGVIKKMLHSFGATISSPPPTSCVGNNLVSALNDLDALEGQPQVLDTNIRSEERDLSHIVSSSPPTFKNTKPLV